MRTFGLLAPTLAIALAATGCSSSSSVPAVSDEDCHDGSKAGCVVSSTAQRITTPPISDADLKLAVSGHTAFGADVYQRLRTKPGNLFFSPYSISSALAMTWAGAHGDTASAMAGALRFSQPSATVHGAFDALDLAFQSRSQGLAPSDGRGFQLVVANALWGQVSYRFETPFLDVLAESYGAGVRVVDFQQASQAVGLIDGWVAKQTHDRIPKLLADDAVDGDTKLVLTNAVYFDAAWATPFRPEDTVSAPFTRRDGSVVSTPTLVGYSESGYAAGPGWAAAELPYEGQKLAMVVILPDAGTIDAFEQSLDGPALEGMLSGLTTHGIDLRLPKQKIASAFELKDVLSDLGMAVAFTDSADFSGISTQSALTIKSVVHQAFVSVDETGTEAAAATAVVAGDTSAAAEQATMHVDRPFLFVIRDRPTGEILFVGRVEDPTGS